MKLITFEGIKRKYKLGQAQACCVIKLANYHQAEYRKDDRTPKWYFDDAEIKKIVKGLKERLHKPLDF
jgi:hypothetical protein